MRYPIYLQESIYDCGPTCIKMILKMNHQSVQLKQLKKLCKASSKGVSVYGMMQCLSECNVKARAMQGTLEQLCEEEHLPCILHLNKDGLLHYVVLYKIADNAFIIGDPAIGKVALTFEELKECYTGICILIDFVGVVPQAYKEVCFYQFYIQQLKKHYSKILHIVSATFVLGIVSVMCSTYFQVIIDIAEDKSFYIFFIFTIGYMILSMLKFLIEYKIKNQFIALTIEQEKELVLNTIQHIVYTDYSVLLQDKESLLLHKMNSLKSIVYFMNQVFMSLFIDTVFMIVIFIALYLINPTIAVIHIVCLCCLSFLLYIFMKQVKEITKLDHKNKEQFQTVLGDYLTNLKMIKQFQSIKFYKNKLKMYFSLSAYSYQEKEILIAKVKCMVETCMHFILYIVTAYVFWLFTLDKVTIGTVVLVYMLYSYSFEPIISFVSILIEKPEQIVLYQRYQSFLPNKKIKKKRINEIKTISFEHVSYGYGYGINVLEDITFLMDKSIVLQGEIGSGKSTFLQLMMGFDTPTKGEVYINGYPIRDCDLSVLYQKMIYLDKNPILFNESLRYNLLLDNEVLEKEMIDFLIQFKLEELIKRLDDIVTNERCFLSSGQQQIILIIRALLKKPYVLLLDEALCNVDVERLDLIYDYIFNYENKMLVVLVTHQTKLVKDHVKCAIIKEKQIYMEMNDGN